MKKILFNEDWYFKYTGSDRNLRTFRRRKSIFRMMQ